MEHTQVIIRPVVSEKSYVLSAADRYTFRVHPDAHKTQIRQAVEELFDVHVVEVRTMSVKSKPKRRGTTAGRTRTWKKAIVQVARRREHPDLPGPAGARGLGLADADSQAQADEPRHALRLLPGLRRDHEVEAREVARRRAQEERRAQRARAQDRPPSRRRRQARLPAHRLQAAQGRRRRARGRDRVRPQPLRLHRAAALRRRREALHPRAPAPHASA